jgi:hypothetical protein
MPVCLPFWPTYIESLVYNTSLVHDTRKTRVVADKQEETSSLGDVFVNMCHCLKCLTRATKRHSAKLKTRMALHMQPTQGPNTHPQNVLIMLCSLHNACSLVQRDSTSNPISNA